MEMMYPDIVFTSLGAATDAFLNTIQKIDLIAAYKLYNENIRVENVRAFSRELLYNILRDKGINEGDAAELILQFLPTSEEQEERKFGGEMNFVVEGNKISRKDVFLPISDMGVTDPFILGVEQIDRSAAYFLYNEEIHGDNLAQTIVSEDQLKQLTSKMDGKMPFGRVLRVQNFIRKFLETGPPPENESIADSPTDTTINPDIIVQQQVTNSQNCNARPNVRHSTRRNSLPVEVSPSSNVDPFTASNNHSNTAGVNDYAHQKNKKRKHNHNDSDSEEPPLKVPNTRKKSNESQLNGERLVPKDEVTEDNFNIPCGTVIRDTKKLCGRMNCHYHKYKKLK